MNLLRQRQQSAQRHEANRERIERQHEQERDEKLVGHGLIPNRTPHYLGEHFKFRYEDARSERIGIVSASAVTSSGINIAPMTIHQSRCMDTFVQTC